jgi:hypothetical protein
VYVSWSSSSIYGGDSGNRIFVLYWRCSLIRVSVITGSTVFHFSGQLTEDLLGVYGVLDLNSISEHLTRHEHHIHK